MTLEASKQSINNNKSSSLYTHYTYTYTNNCKNATDRIETRQHLQMTYLAIGKIWLKMATKCTVSKQAKQSMSYIEV